MQFITASIIAIISLASAAPFAAPLDAAAAVDNSNQATATVNSAAIDAAGPRRGRGGNGGGNNQWGADFWRGLTNPFSGGNNFASSFGSILSGSLISLGEGAIAGAVNAATPQPTVVVAPPPAYYPPADPYGYTAQPAYPPAYNPYAPASPYTPY